MEYRNLSQCQAYQRLGRLNTPALKDVITPERIRKWQIDLGGALTFNYGATPVDQDILQELKALAEEQELVEKFRALLKGDYINTGENRRVMHHHCRSLELDPVIDNGKNLGNFYHAQKERFMDFAEKVHGAKILGSTGKAFKAVVQIGIGGSDLGPRAMYLALENAYQCRMKAHFISNVDPDDANTVLEQLDLEETLFILVSKSGTTQETLANQNFVLEKCRQAEIDGLNPMKHMVAVTSETSPLADSKELLDAFFMDDYIGGRYSSTSAVGGVLLSLAFGASVFQEFLDGAAQADRLAMSEDLFSNAALMDAMLGVYERNIMGYPATVVLPYSQALIRFPAHLQQLDMESNGKSVNRRGEAIDYPTGPSIFGEPGTNGQHSFYQWLHQGTDILPLQFIGFKESQKEGDMNFQGSSSQEKLKANLVAQVIAFALGQKSEDPNKSFAGERPSTLIYGKRLNALALGALLAHYENKVMFQGFCWNVNSFDQEGVQLGKILTKQVLSGRDVDPKLAEYMDLLDL